MQTCRREQEFHERVVGMTVGEAYKVAHEMWTEETIWEVKDPDIIFLHQH